MTSSPEFEFGDAEWLAHRYVEDLDRYRFIHVPRSDHATVPFLTDAALGTRPGPYDVLAEDALALHDQNNLHFLFHSAFCGSTLLARALSVPGVAMGLSEPVILNDIVGFRRRGAPPAAVARAMDGATRLMGRPFARGEAVIVKPSNLLATLAPVMMALRPRAQALFLYVPLESFLVSVVRKGLECRMWVRNLLQGYLHENAADFGYTPEELFRMTDLQAAALGWLAQHRLHATMLARFGAGRLASLDAERMFADPAAALAAVARHYRLALDAGTIAGIVAGPAFTRHSKSGSAFDPAARSDAYQAVRRDHAGEIDLVLQWAEAVAAQNDLALVAPGALAF